MSKWYDLIWRTRMAAQGYMYKILKFAEVLDMCKTMPFDVISVAANTISRQCT